MTGVSFILDPTLISVITEINVLLGACQVIRQASNQVGSGLTLTHCVLQCLWQEPLNKKGGL
jgi:hypothetical protein